MKNIWKYGIIGSCLFIAMIIGVLATTTGYRLLTANSHFNIVEGVQLQYYEKLDDSWHDLSVSQESIDFGQTNLKAGETDTLFLRAKNNASSGRLTLTIVLGESEFLSHSVICIENVSTGTEYTILNNQVHVDLPSDGTWKELGFTTTANGNMAIQDNITFENSVYRDNPIEQYTVKCE